MSDTLLQYILGVWFAVTAALLLALHCPFSSVIPAVVSIYLLGSLLWAKINKQ
jgi:hypothetical protein